MNFEPGEVSRESWEAWAKEVQRKLGEYSVPESIVLDVASVSIGGIIHVEAV